MTENQLRYFVTIVDTGSYMEASLDLDIAQSSISKQIQALEQELGVQLFNRQHKQVKLTDEGSQLLPSARNLVDGMNRLKSTAQKLQEGARSRITLVTLPFVGYLGLYQPIRQFRMDNPTFQIDLLEMEEPQLFRRMDSSEFDIVLTYWHQHHLANSSKTFIPIAQDEVILAVHKDNPLSKLPAIAAEELKAVPLLLMEPYTCVASLCQSFFEENGILPEVVLRGRPETIFGGAEARQGSAMITRKQARSFASAAVALVSITPPLPITMGAVINKYHLDYPKMKEFVDTLVKGPNCPRG
jgi:DNA-binding transcriptional LysR family regulator